MRAIASLNKRDTTADFDSGAPTPSREGGRYLTKALLVLALIAMSVATAQPASADPIGDFNDLKQFVEDCVAPIEVELTANITTADPLTFSCDTILDLKGHDLTLGGITIAAGRHLNITDTGSGDGVLTSDAQANGGPGIETTGAELTIDGGTVIATGGLLSAGIGGRDGLSGGTVTIIGGTVTATGGKRAAGIGGGHEGSGGMTYISGGQVTATGGSWGAGGSDDGGGAGIGGGHDGDGGIVEISGGTVVATGGAGDGATEPGGPGIGGGEGAEAGSIGISGDAHVTASGGIWAAGIGGGSESESGGFVTVAGTATVIATGGEHAAGIGGGRAAPGGGAGGTLLIDSPDAEVIASGWSAVGAGDGSGDFGVLEIKGTLRIPAGSLIVHAGGAVSIGSTGRLLGSASQPTDSATITGDGHIVNQGVIALTDVAPEVSGNHFEVTFDPTGGAPTPTPVIVYAPTFASGYREFPSNPTRAGHSFTGWNDESDGSGADFGGTYVLNDPVGSVDGSPVAITAYATWNPASSGGGVAPPNRTYERVSGPNSVGTGIAASRDLFADHDDPSDQRRRAGSVVIATTTSFPDGLVAAPLAVALDAPLLLTPQRDLDGDVLAEIHRIVAPGTTVHLIGGTDALDEAVADSLTAAGYPLVRHAGATRYDTAVAVADEVAKHTLITKVLIATGHNHPDALGAGVAAAQSGGVVLLSNHDSRHPATSAWLQANAGLDLYAVGGPAASARPEAIPIVGANRYATLAALADTFFDNPTSIGLTRGDRHQDALTGGVHQAHLGGPILATRTTGVPPSTQSWIAENPQVSTVWIYGGSAAIAPGLIAELVIP